MKSLLSRIGLPKALGLCIRDDSVALCEVVLTPLGPVETACREERVESDDLLEVVQRLVGSQIGASKAAPVPVGISLPPERTYFATRPIQNVVQDLSPHVLLREALRSPNVSVDDMAVDVIEAQPDRRRVASIVSCDKSYLVGLLEALRKCGATPHRAEPMPCALLRAAARQHRMFRKSRVVSLLFLGEEHLLAVLVVRGLPMVWRFCDLPRGDEASAVLSASRSLMAVSKDCGNESKLDAVKIHGRPDIARLVDIEWVESQAAAPVEWHQSPALDPGRIAYGAALGCLSRTRERTFDLAHIVKPQASIREMFPWRELAFQGMILIAMGLFLTDRCHELTQEQTVLATRNAQFLSLATTSASDLQKERNELVQKVSAVRKFLSSRIPWTSYERELAECLPENVFLTSFLGQSEFASKKGKAATKGKPKQSLVLRASVPIPADGTIPKEVDTVINTLRDHPLLQERFPVIELADLKRSQDSRNDTSHVSFTILCTPKGAKGRAK